MKSPLCIIPVYNEADILPWTLRHIVEQGCEPYVLDNCSTDGSASLALAGGATLGTYDSNGKYNWSGMLTVIEVIAQRYGQARWCMLYDADEIRRASLIDDVPLSEALERVRFAGYNAVNFQVRCYVPIDNGWTGQCSPEQYFRHYLPEHVDNTMPHIKCWLQGPERVDLHTHGGHQAMFPGRKVYPEKFLLKHYPIRSQHHGERKVFQERLPRYTDAERAKNWHVQYDKWEQTNASFIHDPKDLIEDK